MAEGNRIAVLADDTTGALEMGAHLAAAGLEAVVRTGAGTEQPLPEVAVLDLQTRHMTESQAEAVTARAARAAGGHVFLKTDSTLRGNIPAEIRALSRVFPNRPIVYVPAYPAMGRTVVNGVLYVHGRELSETEFGCDPLNPVRDGSIGLLLARAGVDVTVVDGVTDEDLAAAAEVIRGCIVAGTGGFAPYWARLVAGGRSARRHELPDGRGPWLVVNGSAHPVSRAQFARGRDLDCCTFLSGAVLTDLAAQAHEAIRRNPPAVLIVFGGDTAFAILNALGITEISPIAELLPGVPVSRIRYGSHPIALVTKAGGFGSEDVLLQIRRVLQERS